MTNRYVVTGTITDGRTLHLDEPLPVSVGKVRVTVEVVAASPAPTTSLNEFLDDLHRRRAAEGVRPLTPEEIEAWVDDVRSGRGN